ncbi:TAXI family TRAP transporter solute-binding subunit [Rubrobacter marinus]|uniref:TAXI family TRAP transporter solute-binding subunit n=1 Tax=Rubrobacter marinus TaxID=2653852 RepID=A0A6G8Q0K4_9ACTN|nr:TAXI family TRAP transporter solute-binding subunit [Rubrobacter marinus]QIN80019.1 TAXI family TRAP transporter solute-binding subunit [Rubrobacter marinus]
MSVNKVSVGKTCSIVACLLALVFFVASCGGSGGGGQQGGGGEVNPDDTSPVQATMTGGSSSGFYRLLAESINSVIREEYPGSEVAFEPGSPAGALAQVAQGQVELGAAISPIEERAAIEGQGPFAETGSLEGKYLGVTRLYETQRMHSVMTKAFADEHGIETFADIAEKKPPLRVALNQQGNYQNIRAAEEIFKAYGFSVEDIESWGGSVAYQASGDGVALMADRKVDMFFTSIFIPDSRITDLSRTQDLVWIPMDQEKLEPIAEDLGVLIGTVEPGEYDFVEEQTPTLSVQSDIVTNADVSNQDIYKFVKALHDNQDRMKEIHPSMSGFSPELMVKVQEQVALHPGAEQFYREQGLLE